MEAIMGTLTTMVASNGKWWLATEAMETLITLGSGGSISGVTSSGMSSDHYHTHKDVLCWDCNNMIKKYIWECYSLGGNVNGKEDFTLENMVIVAASWLRRPA